ncbi:hypothetical protein ACFSTC_37335 [Nonomuraea ferruginea]
MLTGACGDNGTPAGTLAWETISLDPVFTLLSVDHPLAVEKEVELADLADEQWAVTPGGRLLQRLLRDGVRAGRVHAGHHLRDRRGHLRAPGAGGPRGGALPGHPPARPPAWWWCR